MSSTTHSIGARGFHDSKERKKNSHGSLRALILSLALSLSLYSVDQKRVKLLKFWSLTNNHCWGAKWLNAWSNNTFQTVGLLWVGSSPQLSGGGCNLIKKCYTWPEILLWRFNTIERQWSRLLHMMSLKPARGVLAIRPGWVPNHTFVFVQERFASTLSPRVHTYTYYRVFPFLININVYRYWAHRASSKATRLFLTKQ